MRRTTGFDGHLRVPGRWLTSRYSRSTSGTLTSNVSFNLGLDASHGRFVLHSVNNAESNLDILERINKVFPSHVTCVRAEVADFLKSSKDWIYQESILLLYR